MADGSFSACQGASNWRPLDASRGVLLVMVGLATVALESSIASPVFVPARTGGHIKEYTEDIWEKSRERLTLSSYFLRYLSIAVVPTLPTPPVPPCEGTPPINGGWAPSMKDTSAQF